MVVASPTSTTPTTLRSRSNPKRPPLLPSERDNNNNNNNNSNNNNNNNNVAVTITPHHHQHHNNRRSKSREISSRYMSTSSSSSTSGSASSSSNSSYFSSSSRRCPSPVPSTTPKTSSRSQSVERRLPSTPRVRDEMSAAAKLLISSSKGSSISFQGGLFSTKNTAKVSPLSKPTPDRKLSSSRTISRTTGDNNNNNNGRLHEQHQPWPGTTRPPISSFSRSVDFGSREGKKLINGSAPTKVVRALQKSLNADCKLNTSNSKDDIIVNTSKSKDDIVNGVRDDYNASSLVSESLSSDRESVSSEANSASQDGTNASFGPTKSGGRSMPVPAKFWQEANSFRSKRAPDPGFPVPRNSLLKGGPVPPKLILPNRSTSDCPGPSPRGPDRYRGSSSPLRGSLRPSSPSHLGSSLRPASPSTPGVSFRSASPSKLGLSMRPASPSKLGPLMRPASPNKPGPSVRPASPSKPGPSMRPSSPSKPGPSLRPASPSKLGASLRPASPSKLGTSLRPSSPRNLGTSWPASPKILGSSLRPASPNRLGTSLASEKAIPSGGMGRVASPSRVRNAIAGAFANTVSGMPSVLCFGADVRRVRVGDGRLGDAHLLRILHNRHLQWRFVNARAEASSSAQKFNAERNLCNAWRATSNLREAVCSRRIELRWLKQNLKLVSILKGQMVYLEQWAVMVKDHCSSLSGAIESLKATTVRLPLVGGAKAEIQDVKDAICSAADVMHAMASSICFLLEKVEEVNSLVAEVANITLKEQSFLNECKDILSMLAAMQVEDCSLRAHMLQLKCAPSIQAVEV